MADDKNSVKDLLEEQQSKIYYYRLDFKRLVEILAIYLLKGSVRRNSFLDSCNKRELYIKIIDEGYPITGSFIEELDDFFINRNEDGVLIREENIEPEYVYLNKVTKNFKILGIDEERTKIFPVEYELIGNPELLRKEYNESI